MAQKSLFGRFAKATSRAAGRPMTFIVALGIVVTWLLTGPIFGYSDTWQLLINTFTTVATFLMVFLIQATQNRDTEALQVKIDELIRVTEGAHTALLDLEELDETELDRIRDAYEKIAAEARKARRKGKDDTGSPKVDEENTGKST